MASGGEETEDVQEGQDYDYLMSMPCWSFSLEEKEKILMKRDKKVYMPIFYKRE